MTMGMGKIRAAVWVALGLTCAAGEQVENW